MTDDRLLVPMQLTAMVVSRAAKLLTDFDRSLPDYTQLKRFNPVGPAPFSGDSSEDPQPGVHLHWVLPGPLRHAPDARAGGAGFRLVPNRWAVVRVPTGGAAAGQPAKAWLLLSDQVSSDGKSPYVDPATPSTEIPRQVMIGCSIALDAKGVTLADTGEPFLRAVGPGSATFSVFAPASQNILGFYDQLDEFTTGASTFTYHVAGWYSASRHDPLRKVTWTAQTGDQETGAWADDTFGFVAWTGATEPPKQMLVHGFVHGVAWNPDGPNAPLPSYPKDVPATVTVAVGNTAIDALSEVVANGHGPAEGQMLQAFQYGLLDRYDQPASATALDREIRRHWFSAAPGGTVWRVVAAQQDATTLPTPPPAPLTATQAVKLDKLNADQHKLDRQSRILDSMRWTLAALWWKHQWAAADQLRPVPGIDRDWMIAQLAVQLGLASASAGGVTPYLTQVQKQAADVAKLADEVTADCTDLDRALDPALQQRKAANMPQYFAPTDPTVLVTGLGRSTILDPSGALTCRVASQTVDSAGPNTPSVPALSDPNGWLVPGVQELHTEAVILSSQPPATSGPLPETRFPPMAIAMAPWQPPWMPVLLDWEVTILNAPAYSGSDTTSPLWAFDQTKWWFDGTDYTWNGSKDPAAFDESAALQMQLQGRTFITPHLPVTLASQLHDFVAQHGARDPAIAALEKDLDTTLQGVAAQDILSQDLSGLRRLLIQRDPAPTAAPLPGPIADALGTDPQRGHPRPFGADVLWPVWDFTPVAGTFFVIDRLAVIDHQGQAVDLTAANHNPVKDGDKSGGFYPLPATGVRTPMSAPLPPPPAPPPPGVSTRMLQLPPRLSQEAQVRFSLRSADGTDTDVTLDALASPICGWLVPNHLDRSLAVYDAGGAALGELTSPSEPRAGDKPVWTPDPTTSNGKVANQYLAGLLAPLAEDATRLDDLLQTIDETLWTIEPGTTRADQDLTVLIGRPLAVVRAELSLTLRGLRAMSQDWWNTFAVDANNPPQPPDRPAALAAVDGGLGSMTWPLRLGDAALRDDGLIGYFVDDPAKPSDAWSTLMAVSPPPGVAGGYVQVPGSKEVPYPELRFIDDTVTSPDPARQEVLRLTLLVDPRASVHVFTGLLPVTALDVPAWYTAASLRAMSFLFRAGPILTPPDEVRFPRPAVRRGRWSWFDHALGTTTHLAPADGKATLPRTPARAVEGWLKFTPNPPRDDHHE